MADHTIPIPTRAPDGLGLVWTDRGIATNSQGPYRDVFAPQTPLFRSAWADWSSRSTLRSWGYAASDTHTWVYLRALPSPAAMAEVEARAQRALDRIATHGQSVRDRLQATLDEIGWAVMPKQVGEMRRLIAEGFVTGADLARGADLSDMAWASVQRARDSIANRASGVRPDLRARCEEPETQCLVLAACTFLSERDADLASVQNGEGWSQSDTRRGHVLSAMSSLDAAHTAVALDIVRGHRMQLPDDMRLALYGPEVAAPRRRRAA